jgi:hypothetical protein
MPAHLPWSQACENNKGPILSVLQRHFAGARRVLEIGSGTGQHAVHFARGLPHVEWLTSDRAPNHGAILQWLNHAPAPNLRPPLALDVTQMPWPVVEVDAVFSANTAHIMDWDAVCAMFHGVSSLLLEGSPFALYGPFSYGGRHTSAGNEHFDASLRAAGEGMGIRDVDDLRTLGTEAGLVLAADDAMPANNRTLLWHRA